MYKCHNDNIVYDQQKNKKTKSHGGSQSDYNRNKYQGRGKR
jgi:hypothetical protein